MSSDRREIRNPAHFVPQKFTFDLKGDLKLRRVFLRNISEKGLGCIALGSEFLGRGCQLTSPSGIDYTVRWVKVKFGFIYEFGLERAA